MRVFACLFGWWLLVISTRRAAGADALVHPKRLSLMIYYQVSCGQTRVAPNDRRGSETVDRVVYLFNAGACFSYARSSTRTSKKKPDTIVATKLLLLMFRFGGPVCLCIYFSSCITRSAEFECVKCVRARALDFTRARQST